MWYIVKKTLFNKKDLITLSICIFFLLLQAGFDIALPMILTNLSNSLVNWADQTSPVFQNNTHAINEALKYFGIMAGLCISELIVGIVGWVIGSRLAVKLVSDLRYSTYSKVQKLSFSDLDKFKTSTLLTILTTDSQAIQSALISTFTIGFRSIFIYIGGLVAVVIEVIENSASSSQQWIVPLVTVIISVSLFIVLGLIMFKSIKWHNQTKKVTDDVNSSIRENILGVRVVKSFNLQEIQFNKFNTINKNLQNVATRAYVISMWVYPIINFSLSATIVIIIWIGGLTKAFEISNIASLMSVITLLLMGMVLLIQVILLINAAIPSAKRTKEVLEYTPTLTYNENGYNIDNSHIQFKNVNFKYHDTGDYVLKNINLDIKPNETIGIIGGTGSGKSTLVNLIARMYDINEGELLISDKNIKDINENSLRKNIALSPQKVTLFSGTIASNLKFGKSDATLDEMKKAAMGAQALEFIMQKENGFDSVVEQRGANFSGGQKQRLSIARALIKNPKILILDSSTSALDMITEKTVNEYIKNSNVDRTTIIVSQRISGVKDTDKIVVLENGEIVGFGDHKKLLKSCKQYYDIAISQMGYEGVQNEMK